MNIRWKKIYKTGFLEIDQWNKKLFKIFNELCSFVLLEEYFDHVGKLLERLIKESEIHFLSEESVLKNSDLSVEEIRNHLGHHSEFIIKLKKAKVEFDAGNVHISYQIINYLRKWIIDHIMKFDRLRSENSADRLVV